MPDEKVFTLKEVEDIAEHAAERAVATLFAKFDIDVNDQKAMIQHRKNLEFLDNQRQGSEALKANAKKASLYVIGIFLMGAVYVGWDAFRIGVKSLFIGWLGSP